MNFWRSFDSNCKQLAHNQLKDSIRPSNCLRLSTCGQSNIQRLKYPLRFFAICGVVLEMSALFCVLRGINITLSRSTGRYTISSVTHSCHVVPDHVDLPNPFAHFGTHTLSGKSVKGYTIFITYYYRVAPGLFATVNGV